MQAPPPLPKKASSDYVSRHWKLIVVGAVLAGLVVLTAIAGLVVVGVKMMKSSSVYSEALARVKSSPAATAALGTPVKDGFVFTGHISESDSSGRAGFTIPVSGPKGGGILTVIATKSDGEWHYDNLTLRLDKTQERIDLLNTNQ